ncbi:MAG TPA: S26 family signal peptidase [Bacilli bacterium]|nr:S26 family signal peptidase [Bacilli bacterium]
MMETEVLSKKRKIVKRIANTLYVGILSFVIFIFLLTTVVPNGLIKVFGVGYYRVTSPSMEPTIRVNDYVVVKKTKLENLTEGEIIVFETNAQLTGIPVTERVVVIHYFGYVDDNGHILTYSEEKKNYEADNPDKYDTWGTESTPYYVTEKDLVGVYSKLIPSADLIDEMKIVVSSTYFYLAIAGIAGVSVGIYYLTKHHRKKVNSK